MDFYLKIIEILKERGCNPSIIDFFLMLGKKGLMDEFVAALRIF